MTSKYGNLKTNEEGRLIKKMNETNEMKKLKRKNTIKGVTLIALVVTIIVLLILAGVTIVTLMGDNGILTMAAKAKEETEIGKEKETVELAVLALKNDVINEETLKEKVDSIGNTDSEVTSAGEGEYLVVFPSKRAYEVDINGNVIYVGKGKEVTITANKESDLNPKQIEEVEITARNLKIEENESMTIKYCWSMSNTEKPQNSEYKIAESEGTNYKQKATIMSGNQKTGNYYLWIKVQVGTKEVEKTFGKYYIREYTTLDITEKDGIGFLGNTDIQRSRIKSITITNSIEGKEVGVDKCWDVSTTKKGFILAWYTEEVIDGETYYNVTIGSNEEKVVANANSRGLFLNIGKDVNGEVKIEGLQYLDTSKVTNMRDMFSGSKVTNLDLSRFDTSNVTSMEGMFNRCTQLTSIDISKFITNKVSTMGDMFYGCSELVSVNAGSLNINSVTIMSRMFQGCSKLTNIDLSKWVSDNTIVMTSMFQECSGLKSVIIGNFKASAVNSIFYGCSNLTNLDISNLNTSNVANMSRAFYGCSNLENVNLSNMDTSNVNNMSRMFAECKLLTSLDLTNFSVINVFSMTEMFRNCSNLITLNLGNFDTSNVTTMSGMFYGCRKLINLDTSKFNTVNVKDMSSMFKHCASFTDLDLSTFNVKNVTNMGQMFEGCTSLKKLDFKNWEINSELSNENIFTFGFPTDIKIYVSTEEMKTWVLGANLNFTDENVVVEK